MADVYEWANALRVKAANGISLNDKPDPSVVGSVIESIQQKNNGVCHPKQLVEVSRSPKAKTHKMFEWNDKVAGERYREDQARLAIRCLVVTYEHGDGKDREVKAFSQVQRDEDGNGYARTIEAMSDDLDRDYILNAALSQLRAWRRRWNQLNEVADTVTALKKIDAAIDDLRKVVAK